MLNPPLRKSDFVTEVTARVDEVLLRSHDQVILRFLEELGNFSPGCSYRKYIFLYTSLKILHHHIGKKQDRHRITPGLSLEVMRQRVNDSETKMSYAHRLMYTAPCHVCYACRSRVKPWPKHIETYAGRD